MRKENEFHSAIEVALKFDQLAGAQKRSFATFEMFKA
jgi:hypothetical protein